MADNQSKWILIIWFIFFLASPFYIFGSGLPQPADWLIAGIFVYLLVSGTRPLYGVQQKVESRHLHFVIYVTIVNTVWFFFIDQSREKRFPTFVHSFFYIFNFFSLRTVLLLFRAFKERFLAYTGYAIGASMILQAALSFALGSTGSRNALFFNNPNQLGYYALLSGSLFIYMAKQTKLKSYFQLVTFFSFFYLTLLSSSKAALSGSIILIGLAVINQGLLNIRQSVILCLAIGVGYYFVLKQELGSELFQYSLNRFELIGKSRDDSYEGRGYDRILNNPGYMVLGAGEGGYSRFDTLLVAGEIHSSFGTLIFCYGIVGFALFLRFLVGIFYKSSFFDLLYFVPVFAYSVTHQGLRDTLFWVFLGVVFAVNHEKFMFSVYRKKRAAIPLTKLKSVNV